MAMIARTMLRSSPAAYMGVRAMSTEIPINSVARVVRSHVADEEAAMKADALVTDAKAKIEAAGLPGYEKVVRTVCKAEWAYEVAVVFDSLDNFKGYMESDFRTETMEPALADFGKLATSELYVGNRVYDEL